MGKPVWGGGPGVGFGSSPSRALPGGSSSQTSYKLPGTGCAADLQILPPREAPQKLNLAGHR